MAESTNEAKFRVTIDGNADSSMKNVAQSGRLAAKTIEKYEAEIKTLGGDLRRLTGNSEEVIEAKKKLRDRINAAKSSVTTLTLELNKQGHSYEKAAKAAREYDKASTFKRAATRAKEVGGDLLGKGGKALAPVGKKVSTALAPVGEKLGKVFGPAAKKVSTALAPVGKRVASMAAPAGRAIGGLGRLTGRAAGGLVSLGKKAAPIAEKGLSSLANVGSLAATGYAALVVGAGAAAAAVVAFGFAASDSAAKLGRQREALLGNAKDSKALGDQINALASKVPQGVEELNDLSKSLLKTRLSGKDVVNTMNAVAQVTGAVDATAGAKIQELITRNHRMGRMAIGQFELEGTGINFDEVAKEYAKGTKKSVAAAAAELRSGRASIEAGSEALAKVAETKFGKLNIANAFSLENAPKKFFEQVQHLASGLDLEPVTKGFQYAFGQLTPEAPLGRAIKAFFEGTGSDIAKIVGKSIPLLVEGFKWIVVGALRVSTYVYEMKARLQEAFDSKGWVAAGKELVVGLVEGIIGQRKFVIDAVVGLAKSVKDTFTGKMEIHSPSKVFKEYGEFTTEGYAQGVERGSRRANAAVSNMVQAPTANSSSPATSTGAPRVGSITVQINGAPVDNIQAMQSPQFLGGLTRALRDSLSMQGLAGGAA